MAEEWDLEFEPGIGELLKHLPIPLIKKFWSFFERLEKGPISRDELRQHPGIYQRKIDKWLVTYIREETNSSKKIIVTSLDFLELR